MDDVDSSDVSAVPEAGLSGGVSEAGAMLADGNRQRESGELASAILLYLDLMDKHPDTAEMRGAYEALQQVYGFVVLNGMEPSIVQDLDAGAPSLDELSSTPAKYMLCTYWLMKSDYLSDSGHRRESSVLYEECWQMTLSVMRRDSDSAFQMACGVLLKELLRKLPESRRNGAAEELEAVCKECPGTKTDLACRYVLADYFLHAGMNREEAERHFAALLAAEESRGKAVADVKPRRSLDWIDAAEKWAKGYARFELNRLDDALVVLEDLKNDRPDESAPWWAGEPNQWAAITKPMAIQRQHRGEPEVAIRAYEDYLTENPDGVYTDYAHLEMGNLYRETGDEAKAEENYLEAMYDVKHPEACATARKQLDELRESREADTERATE